MPVIRSSKVKHVFGKANKREECYDCIRITKSSWDSTFCSVNPKFLAIITEAAGGGAFLVLPIEKTGRVDAEAPLVAGHKAAVLDIAWCPHDDWVIASASEDCTVKIWRIPEGGIKPKEKLTEPIADLVAHQRRVGLVLWHPTAEHVLLSAGADNMVFLWNVSTEQILVQMSFPDVIYSASFNYNGSRLVTVCKDKITRVVNPRTGEVLHEGQCHEGAKPQQCLYVKDDRIVTTGFSRMSERQFGLWNGDTLKEPLKMENLDSTNGTLFPFFDGDCNLLYLCGKGDSVIRYYELTTDEDYAYPIGMYQSSDPQRGFGWMPKRGLNVNANEIGRCYKLHQKGLCEVIPFTIPRKSELFQEDLYPDAVGEEAAVNAEDWMGGQDVDPILVSLKDGFSKTIGAHEKKAGFQKPSRVQSIPKTHPANKGTGSGTPDHSSNGHDGPQSGEQTQLIQSLRDEVVSLKKLCASLEQRVSALESKNN
jgi:coronin-1B/1C/6